MSASQLAEPCAVEPDRPGPELERRVGGRVAAEAGRHGEQLVDRDLLAPGRRVRARQGAEVREDLLRLGVLRQQAVVDRQPGDQGAPGLAGRRHGADRVDVPRRADEVAVADDHAGAAVPVPVVEGVGEPAGVDALRGRRGRGPGPAGPDVGEGRAEPAGGEEAEAGRDVACPPGRHGLLPPLVRGRARGRPPVIGPAPPSRQSRTWTTGSGRPRVRASPGGWVDGAVSPIPRVPILAAASPES